MYMQTNNQLAQIVSSMSMTTTINPTTKATTIPMAAIANQQLS